MKRAFAIPAGVIAVAGIAAAAVVWTRPDLLPDWARFGRAEPPKAEHSADSGLFCNEHGVPEKFCTICHPELKDKLLLCKEHNDIPEDICTLCHPEVAKQHNLKVCPHGLPRHFCKDCAGDPQASN